jgi:hypothetical protein
MDRRELDAFVERHALSGEHVALAFEVSGARPAAADVRRFAVRMLRLAGVLSLAAGVVFFVAANWDALAVVGRFALVESALVASAGLALFRPPPRATGRHALLLALFMTGALIALFGQTFQTGADAYELFLTWAALGLPFAIAAQWSVTWAAWLVVLNTALGLYCGFRPESGWLWVALGTSSHASALFVGPMMFDVALWLAITNLEGTRLASLAPRWLERLVLTLALGFGTTAGITAIDETRTLLGAVSSNLASLAAVLVMLGVVATVAVQKRRDVFPLALVAASTIALVTSFFVIRFEFETGMFFLVSSWLIVSSTVSARVLMHLVRAWRTEAKPA